MKKRQFFLLMCLFLCSTFYALAQNSTVTGLVSGQDGAPLPNVSVTVTGTGLGTATNEDGAFSVNVPADGTLTFTFIGYESQTIPVNGQTTINVTLAEDATALDEVVVTALGIERKSKSLTYSTQVVKGEDMTRVKDANPMNNLTGKVSGLQINRSSSGVGGSVNIILRGFKSNRNNQPLYVIDGMPITNTGGSGTSGAFGGDTDKGDILSTLNPEDIASINVLKGASASALYGSQGANGAIMITTKKGQAGRTRIDISSGVSLDQAFYLPEMQYSYGQTTPGAEDSWGAKGSFNDHVSDFFDTGVTLMNSVSLSGGTEKMQNYFSYGNTTNNGILPTSKFGQHSATFRNSTKFFEDRLSFDGSLMYSQQKVHNRPSSGLYFGALPGLYMFPRGLDFNDYKNNYEYFSESRNLHLQNWYNINYDAGLSGNHNTQNPYWVLNRNPNDQTRSNIIGQAQFAFKITDWLTASARGTINKRWDTWERRAYAGTQGVTGGQPIPGVLNDNGRYQRSSGESTSLYGDFLVSGNRQWNDWELSFTAGTSINDERAKDWYFDARRLVVANKFLMSNIYRDQPINNFNDNVGRRQIQSLFASANVGFQGKVYLDATARNDWASTLAFTPASNSGYFYWSAGVTAVLSEIVDLPDFMTYGKLRFSFAEVGNDVAQYSTYPTNGLSTGTLTPNVSGPYLGLPLKPETQQSFELGYEGRFWNDRINLDVALYKTNTRDQYFEYQGPVGVVNTTVFLNAGNVENKGLEVAAGADIFREGKFKWNTGANLTMNRNKIVELAPNLGERYDVGGNYNVMRVGGSFGDFWASTFLRDENGTIIVDENGAPQNGGEGYIGNNNPSALIGWNNTFSYGDFSLSLSVDGRFGGQVISVTEGFLNSFGYSQRSADARDAGGLDIPAVRTDGTPWEGLLPTQAYYQGVGNREGIIEGQVYDATNIRLREVALSYRLPIQWEGIQQARVSLTGRNLFFFRNDAPYDPELNTTTGVGGQGLDTFGLPTTRQFGFTLNVSF